MCFASTWIQMHLCPCLCACFRMTSALDHGAKTMLLSLLLFAVKKDAAPARGLSGGIPQQQQNNGANFVPLLLAHSSDRLWGKSRV